MDNNNLDTQDQKTINITGQNNRYQMKKLIRDHNPEPKKREISKSWSFSEEYFNYDKQIIIIHDILNDISNNDISNNDISNNDITQIVIQEINKKIYGYKHQDIIKKKLDIEHFIDFKCVINKMIECELKCRYCKCEMVILYDITREMKQWSVDRIDNNKGHNKDNFHLACLDCNLKRRRKTDENFLFTKQLNIVKHD